MTLNQQVTKGVSELSGVIDPNCHRVTGPQFHSGYTEYRRFLRAFFILQWPMMKVNAKVQERNPGIINNGPDP